MNRLHLHRTAVIALLVGAVGLALVPWGGFVLFPVAFDLWESGRRSDETAG